MHTNGLVSLSHGGRSSRLGGTSPVILAGSAYFSTNTSVDHYPHSPRLARPSASDATPPLPPRRFDFVAYNCRMAESCTYVHNTSQPREAPGISCNLLYGKSLHSDLHCREQSGRSTKADSTKMYYISTK